MQKHLTTCCKTAAVALLGAAVMLMNAHYASAAPQDAAKQDTGKKQKQVKDTGEYDIYNDVIKDANPTAPNYKKLLTDLDTWTQKYPNTDYKDERQAYYVQGYGGTQQFGKALDAIHDLANGDVAGVKSALGSAPLILPTLMVAVQSAAQGAAAGTLSPDELATGSKVAQLLIDYAKDYFTAANKPANLSDAQWAKGRDDIENTAKGAQLQLALYPATSILKGSKDPAVCAKAEPAFVKALQDRPDSGQISLQLAGVLFCQRNGSQDKLSQALYEYARAVTDPVGPPFGLDATNQKNFEDFLKRTYTTLHGSDEGFDQLKESAKASPMPPAGFKIKTASEIANEKAAEFAKQNPQLAMWVGIENQLTADNGQTYFDGTLKDADVKGENGARALKGTVVGMMSKVGEAKEKPATCNPNELLVAIPLPGQTGEAANTPKVKLHILNGTLKGKVENGTEVSWDGVPTAFTKEPFLLTMELDDAKKLDVATTACPVPKKSAAPPATRKKGGE